LRPEARNILAPPEFEVKHRCISAEKVTAEHARVILSFLEVNETYLTLKTNSIKLDMGESKDVEV